METGIYVVGIFHNLESRPWANDETRFNHRLIVNSPYQDQYGNNQVDVALVDLQQADIEKLRNDIVKYKDKKVLVPVRMAARVGGRDGAWLSLRMPKGALIQIVTDKS